MLFLWCILLAAWVLDLILLLFPHYLPSTSAQFSFPFIFHVITDVGVHVPSQNTAGLRPSELSTFHVSMSIGVCLVWVMFRLPCWWDFEGVVSDISRWYNLTANFLSLWVLQSFYYPLLWWSLSLRCRNCVVDLSVGAGLHNSSFWLVLTVCCKEKLSWWGQRMTLIYRYKDKYLECR